MCEYCEPDKAGNLRWLREEPDSWAYLEESGGDWGIVASVSTRCCGTDCTTEFYMPVNHCPMCGRGFNPVQRVMNYASAPAMRNSEADKAYERGRFDERLQQEIMKGAC